MTTRISILAHLVAVLPVLSLALLVTIPAKADAIDGHWCAEDGRHLSIQGPAITTPGGKRMRGDYRRHYFSYVIPALEPHAGATTNMTLINDNELRLKVQVDAAKTETWRRCDFTS